MHVGLNEPRQNEHAFGVDLRGAARRGKAWRPRPAQCRDSPVADENIAAKYATGPVHRDEGAALDQQSLLTHAEP